MAGNTVPIHGKIARTAKNDVLVEFTEGWEVNVEVDYDDTSRQGKHWKEAIAGQAGWSGTIATQLVTANTEQAALLANILAGTPGALLTDMKFMLEDTSDYLIGDIFLNSLPIVASVAGKVMATYGFLGNEEVALVTA